MGGRSAVTLVEEGSRAWGLALLCCASANFGPLGALLTVDGRVADGVRPQATTRAWKADCRERADGVDTVLKFYGVVACCLARKGATQPSEGARRATRESQRNAEGRWWILMVSPDCRSTLLAASHHGSSWSCCCSFYYNHLSCVSF